jgi:glutamate-1-semialdehyde aminotransferase
MTVEIGVQVRFTHFGSFFAIAMSESRITQDTVNLLSFLLLTAGVHLRAGDRGGFLSTAHSDADIATVFDAFASGLSTLASVGLLERHERTINA